ncbi:fra a 1-associated protein [Gastrolobium bilobum]|uniref:fra a 1-associated protein n=1 Tax=Gastrolobium bilobum TaxID=150636 RepID=UPI002AB19294|nr:fra a 1-associated protein [Gastrolobium bilobum]
MGWVWSDDDDDNRGDNQLNSSSCDGERERCSTSKIVKSKCRTEEVESGKFVRKCEKTEELLKNCIGRPAEVVQSHTEYTEEDVTHKLLKGGSPAFSSSYSSSDRGVFDLPGLRSDIEVMERNLFGGLSRFFEAAEEMKNGFFDVFVNSTPVFDGESSSSPSVRRGIPIEEYRRQKASPEPKEKELTDHDFAALAKDI